MNKLLDWLAGGAISSIGEIILKFQGQYLEAETSEKKMELEKSLTLLQAQKEVLVAESKQVLTSITKFLLAAPAIIYWWKLVVWDTVLGWGITPYPGEHVIWYVTLIPPAYFVSFFAERNMK